MSATIIRGDARHLPLPDASVDLIVTSPPYYGLRDYRDGDQSLAGQIGAEPTPHEYIAALLECTREWTRVLKPSGSLWINLGDSYYSGKGASHGQDAKSPARRFGVRPLDRSGLGFPRKSLLGLPWRYAIGCIDDLGLTLRAEVIWDKPNGLPESVTDRVRRSHEHWFHFTLKPRYYSAVDEIRETHTRIDPPRRLGTRNQTQRHQAATDNVGWKDRPVGHNPLGKLPGSVWEIASQPLIVPEHLGVDHYAAFPMEFPRRIIRGWSPPCICTECGDGLRPVVDREPMIWRESPTIAGRTGDRSYKPASGTMLAPAQKRITGYACACPTPAAPTRPAVVLDPFGGTGTTALLATVLGRRGISVDRSADYCRIAQWRTTDPGERARAMQVPKPQPIPETQPSLFDDDLDEAIA